MLPLALIQRAVPPPPGGQYPLITGANTTELLPGRATESAPILAALRLIAAFDHSPMAVLADLHRIDVSAPEILQVATGQQNEITFRAAALDRQLQRWRLVHEKASSSRGRSRRWICRWPTTFPCAGRRGRPRPRPRPN